MTLDTNLDDTGAKLIDAVLTMLQGSGDWPTFDQVDRHADRRLRIADAESVLLSLPDGLVSGLGYMSSIPANEPIKLTVRAVHGCEGGSELADAFVRSVALSARLEEERLETEPPPILTPDDIGPSLRAAGRTDLLKQLGKLLDVERWGSTMAATDFPWSFTIGRGVRRFRGVETIEDYLRRSTADDVSAGSDSPSALAEVTAPDPDPPDVVRRGPQAALRITKLPPILDAEDHEHELRWPRTIVRDELRRLVAQMERQPTRKASSPPHIARLLREAFEGQALALEFKANLTSDHQADEYITSHGLEWLHRLTVELEAWPDRRGPPLFYSQRHRPVVHEPDTREDTVRRLVTVVQSLTDDGLFAEQFGLSCPDGHGDPRESPDDQFKRLLGRRLGDAVWPLKEHQIEDWTDDDLYDVLEVLRSAASWPGTWHSHNFGGCPGHPGSFSRPLGRALYRWCINDVLDDSPLGVRLAESGEDEGRIVKAVGESTTLVIETAVEQPIPGDAAVVAHAIATFRGRQRTPETLRNAIVDLAGVLERHRKVLKQEMLSKDEAALFEIANNFDLRHRNQQQRGDYDLNFSEWLFQWYLATVTLLARLIEKRGTE